MTGNSPYWSRIWKFRLELTPNKGYTVVMAGTLSQNSFSRFFSRIFPVPSYLRSRSFGLDLSDESLKFIELIETRNGIRVGRHGERKIPPGIIESGKIKDSKRMEEILISLRREEGIKSVRVSLPEEQVYLFGLKLGKDGLKSIREGIELSLEEHIPIAAQDTIFDYELLSEDKDYLHLEVAAIPKNVIENYLLIFDRAMISVQSFELEAQAIARSVIEQGDPDTYMIVDFGEKRTGIFIISSGVAMFTSTLDVGGFTLNNMIQKSFNVSAEESENMKKEYGLKRNATNKEISPVLLGGVAILRDEVQKHFLYWHTHKDEDGRNNTPIREIILCGGDSNLIGLPEYFAISTKNKVEMGNVWINIVNTEKYIPDISFKRALSFAASIGLALGDFER